LRRAAAAARGFARDLRRRFSVRGLPRHPPSTPDQSYVLRRTYLERGVSLDEIGSWLIDDARRTLSLYTE
jgi:hypothetical protein